MGYLGKISAVVTANTVDFSRNLNGAANDLRRFAGAVERDITRATNDANKAFTSMLTPLQRLEQGLRAASSMKLSFKGFAGAIRDVDALKQRLATLRGSDVNLVVKASGMRTISEFRAAIEGIDDKALNFVVNFGGLDRVREIQRELAGLSNQSVSAVVDAGPGGVARLRELRETVRELGGTQLTLALRVGGTERLDRVEQQAIGLSRKDLNLLTKVGGVESLDRVIEELDKVSSTSINALINIRGRAELDQVLEQFRNAAPEQIQAVISVLGARDVEDATNRVRALYSASKQVFEPIAAAAANFDRFGADLQNAFGPALIAVQRQATRLKEDIESGVSIGEQRFNSLAASAQRVAEAIDRIGEASAAIGQLVPSGSLAFQQPEALEAITRARRVQSESLQLSPAQIRAGSFAFRSSQVQEELRVLEQRLAARDAIVAAGPAAGRLGQQRYIADLRSAEESLNRQIAKVNTLVSVWDKVRATQAVFSSESQALAPRSTPAGELVAARQRAQAAVANAPDTVLRESLQRRLQAASRLLARDEGRLAGLQIDDPRVAETLARRRSQFDRITANAGEVFGPPRPPAPPPPLTATDIGLSEELTSSSRQIGLLVNQTNSLQSALESLSAPVQAQFVPALQAARQRLVDLSNSADASAEDIAAASANLRTLEGSVRNASSVDRLRSQFGNFDEFINAGRIRSAAGELETLRNILARVGAQASGPAVQAFNRFREAVALSLENPGNAELQRAVEVARNEAITATSQIRGAGSQRRIRGQLQRAGDVSRFGADNISLALNQAAFAVDDFFSSTGGLEFKIRAISNNITQLGFIVGNTTGLFISLGAVIAAQAVIGISKWINNGRTAEDQTKALNDALARQKSLVEELAQAFESLGDAIARRAFSEPAQQAREFAKEIDAIAKKQRELRETQVADLDIGVQRERATQNRIRRDIESETDPGRRVLLQQELRQSQERERLASQAATSRIVSGDQVAEAVARAVRAQTPTGNQRLEFERRARDAAAAVDRGTSVDAIRSQREAIQRQLNDLAPFSGRRDAREAAAELESLLRSLELPLRTALDQLTVSILQSSQGLSLAVEQAQSDVADAIRRGVPAAADFQAALDNTARQLDEAQKRLTDAQAIDDQDQRDSAVRMAQAEVRDLEMRRDAINEQARVVRLTTGRGGERTTAALSALQGNEDFSNEYGRLVARLRAAIDEELAAQRELNQQIAKRRKIEEDASLTDAQKQAQLQQQQGAEAEARARVDRAAADSDLAAATAEAAQAMNESLSRIKKIGQDALSQSTQLADDAQRQFTRNPTAENRRARDEAERQLISDRERVARANSALARARAEAESDPRISAINDELRAIQEERKRLSDEAAQNGTEVDPRESERLRNREAALQAEREERLRNLTQAEREQADTIAWEVDARRRLIEQLERERQFDEELKRRRDPVGDPTRGLDLMETPGQRAGRELAQGLADINAAFDEQLRSLFDATNGLPNQQIEADAANLRQQRAEAEARLIDQAQRAAAPAIFNLADSVQNAILQGPSRAALNVSDISTQDGARELNRLLRGDDSARDQNLVELQRQSTALEDIQRTLREGVNGVRAA